MSAAKGHAIAAAKAHTDLNTFAAVIAILEGGVIYTSSGARLASEIIRLCRAQAVKQLRAYDAALERLP